jgi:hypothetical protein
MREKTGSAGKTGERKNHVEHGGELLYSFSQAEGLSGRSASALIGQVTRRNRRVMISLGHNAAVTVWSE